MQKRKPGLKNCQRPTKGEAWQRHWRGLHLPHPPSCQPGRETAPPNHPSSFPIFTAFFSSLPFALASGHGPGDRQPEPCESHTSDPVSLIQMLGVLFQVTFPLPRSQERGRRERSKKEEVGKKILKAMTCRLDSFSFGLKGIFWVL